MANRNRSVEKEAGWRGLISAQATSGVSVRRFCLQHEVSEASFYAWRRELARRDEEAGEASPRFLEVVVGDARSSTDLVAMGEPLRIHFEDVRVEVPPGFDRATLAMTLELLRGSAC